MKNAWSEQPNHDDWLGSHEKKDPVTYILLVKCNFVSVVIVGFDFGPYPEMPRA